MFSKLTELFARNFVTGYYLPVLAFIIATLALARLFGIPVPITFEIHSSSDVDTLIEVTLLGVIAWVISIALLAINREILRFMEGYWPPPTSFPLFGHLERQRYHTLCQKIDRLDEEFRTAGAAFPVGKQTQRNKLLRERAEQFPDDERWLLPTAFGNTIRAVEVYSRVMYGLDAIVGWNRLLAVISKEYAVQVDDAKALMDFWVNLWFLSLVVLAEYLGLVLYTRQFNTLFIPLVIVGLALFACVRARSTAIEWGDLVKSSFDVFLPSLCKKLGFAKPTTIEEERSLWQMFSQAVIYSNPDMMPDRYQGQDSEANSSSGTDRYLP